MAHIHVLIKDYIKLCLENFTTSLGPIWLFLHWGVRVTRGTMKDECHVIKGELSFSPSSSSSLFHFHPVRGRPAGCEPQTGLSLFPPGPQSLHLTNGNKPSVKCVGQSRGCWHWVSRGPEESVPHPLGILNL